AGRAAGAAARPRPFRIRTRTGEACETGAFDIDPGTGLLIHADGSLDDAVHVAGIPVDAALHDTVISPMPGTDPPMLRETDRVARSLIAVARRTAAPIRPREGALRA
ncbi:FAD/NAD(P)-binding protein, partial [Leucobacter chromiiresistens]